MRTFGPLPEPARRQIDADIERYLGPHARLFDALPRPVAPIPLPDAPQDGAPESRG